jgi:hypothetical protein
MTVVIKRTDSKELIETKLTHFYALRAKRKIKGFDASKYAGKLKGLYGDGLKYQKKVRDEWGK